LLQTLLDSVRVALERGLHLVFLSSAVLMTAAIVLHVALRNLRLRAHSVEPEVQL
jgi:hypothetical protein